jgi:hypothetical protein
MSVTVRLKHRLVTAAVMLGAVGVLTIATVTHRSTPISPSSKTPPMIRTVKSVAYCIEDYSNGHWLHMNSSDRHFTDGHCP